MGEDPGARAQSGFLPPQPAGPEPDLGAPEEPPPRSPDHLGYAPPLRSQPPYAPQQSAWSSPSAGGQQHAARPWSFSPAPPAPDNGAAVAGISLSVTAGVLLLLSAGTSTIISIACAALGIYYSRKGRIRVDRGETPRHGGVARAGFVIGIVALVLSILATVAWTVVAIQYATDASFRQDLQDELDGEGSSPDGYETSIPVGLAALRLVASLLR